MFEINGCKFKIEYEDDEEVYLVDLIGGVPLENVAEDVFNWLYLHYGDRVFLFVSQHGGIDELRHCGGVFSGVGPYAD